jgi:hypothetical protein
MKPVFEHLQEAYTKKESEERPFIQLEIPEYTKYFNQKVEAKEEKESIRVIIIDL